MWSLCFDAVADAVKSTANAGSGSPGRPIYFAAVLYFFCHGNL